ncbi:hypothetical protein BpHYR1_012470 [Brachionus plicatilis]|uniref:Uncharacterized protein n=1 Tax=Brachionus plicatilis TaxID=10195 RepID=A0A3M7Q3I4_BRAPC|nr:hypothetical protein BpHYR1_012470 [Brachionus plicatilis]
MMIYKEPSFRAFFSIELKICDCKFCKLQKITEYFADLFYCIKQFKIKHFTELKVSLNIDLDYNERRMLNTFIIINYRELNHI